MGKKSIKWWMCAALAVLAVSCDKADPDGGSGEGTVTEPPKPGEYTLSVIETTDIHGHIVSTDNDGTVHYRMAYIADKVNDTRAAGGADNLLLLDGGDLYQGASISNLTSGWPVSASLDRMGYDAVALGNHEFDWSVDTTVDSDATMPDYKWNGNDCINAVPVLCANLYRDGERVSFTRDYVILEKTAAGSAGAKVPVKIGVVGFAVNYSGSIMTAQFNGKGFYINADYSIANGIAAELESTGACDATVLLIHGDAKECAEKLGAESPFDLVLGGHSHRTQKGQTAWGLPYVQGGRYCETFACASLKFTVDAAGGVSFDRVGATACIKVDSSHDTHASASQNAEELSSDLLAVSDAALAAIEQQKKDVLGYIESGATSYYIDGSGKRAAAISNWMCDIIRRIGDADVSFVNSGGIRTSFPLNGASRRSITVADVYDMFPFSNTTYVYQITYADLLRLFEYSMTSGGESLFSRMTGIDCYFTAEDHGSYSTYAVYSLVKDGTVIYAGGTWTGNWASRKLVLAVSEYLATTERTDYYTGIPNPLIGWNSTSRLLSNDMLDNENAIRVLRAEAASSGGRLHIDTTPHFLLRP